MINGENIIIFSSDDWDSGLKTSKYHIAKVFSKENKVLFINSIGMRQPEISRNDFSRAVNKLKNFLKGVQKINDNLYIFTPIIIPFHDNNLIKKFNRVILIVSLRILQVFLRMKSPVLMIFIPNMGFVAGKLGEKSVIYYCIDELKGYKDVNKELFKKAENELLEKADAVIVCSEALFQKKKQLHRFTYYVPHGVEWNLFSKAVKDCLPVPNDIADIKRPIIGYFGFISEDWIDFNLLNCLAKACPECSIVLIGKVRGNLRDKIAEKNVIFLGIKAFEDLPAYCKFFDVAIIPFKINELTLSSNPLKLFEYLAAGIPVVSTAIPELNKYENIVKIAQDYKDFIEGVRTCLGSENEIKKIERSKLVSCESWENRAETISEIIKNHSARK